nr:DUF4411 family protein [Selenomonas sp. oral taxon 920]
MCPARAYYPFDFAPSFWQQLRPKISLDKIAVLDKVREVLKRTAELSAWISDLPNECILSTQDTQILQKYSAVPSLFSKAINTPNPRFVSGREKILVCAKNRKIKYYSIIQPPLHVYRTEGVARFICDSSSRCPRFLV